MEEKERVYIAIDLKSFYASVECVDRGLNPLTTNLVVADLSRTEKTICLAVTPSLKQHGISGRARLFEVVERVREVNEERRRRLPSGCFTGSSSDDVELKARPDLKLNYLVAPPRMARYVEVSRQIYNIYLRHVAPEDIHPYSVDEVFMDVTDYLHYNRLTPHEMAMKMAKSCSARRASPPLPASAPTSIWPRWRWTSWPKRRSPTPTACALPSSTR